MSITEGIENEEQNSCVVFNKNLFHLWTFEFDYPKGRMKLEKKMKKVFDTSVYCAVSALITKMWKSFKSVQSAWPSFRNLWCYHVKSSWLNQYPLLLIYIFVVFYKIHQMKSCNILSSEMNRRTELTCIQNVQMLDVSLCLDFEA